ncbi:MAG: ATP-binding cassette domain-containing protein [Phycisphaera sp.]|nr:ATP-binding cassette domain-containing protein [Phycisphaera sp.]
MTTQDSILKATSLHKHYQMGREDLHVLRGVDISVRAGEWLCILGASGSGKSTLLHLLGGLDTPDRGDVLFNEQDLFSLSSAERDRFRNRHVGFVFQFYHLLPELNVVENTLISAMVGASLGAWTRRRGELRERAVALLDQLGLGERVRHRPNELSGGERQRVAIARALINQPDVLLADEPTGNLDRKTGATILDVLADLHRDHGQTIVMVTHDQSVADRADRVLTLELGKLQKS